MFEKIKEVIIKEFLHIKRDKRMLFFIFMPPLVQIIIFGFAVVSDVKNISTGFCDLDKSFESREILRKIESSDYFNVKYLTNSPKYLEDLIEKGKIKVAIQINNGFSEKLKKEKNGEIQVIIDGTDVNTSSCANGYLNNIFAEYLNKKKKNLVNFKIRIWYNPNLRSQDYNVPAVIAMIITLSCLLLTAMSIVREREAGTLEQLLVAPIKPMELLLGKTIPFILIGYFEAACVFFSSFLIFKIQLKGSVVLLFFCIGIYILNALGIGLFISTVAKTMQQAMMGSFFFFFPAIILSGFMFPIENMPEFVQYFTYLNPLRYFLIIIRGIFLKGNGFFILWKEIFILFLISTSIFTLSALNFRKRIK
jgi:ABC-2 type transport system permease protein